MVKLLALLISALFLISGCGDAGTTAAESTDDGSSTQAYTGKYIFVASGLTFAGTGVTMSAPINVIARFKEDGSFDRIIRDYVSNTADSPVGMAELDEDHLVVMVENTTARRFEIIAKDGSSVTAYPTAGVTTVARDIFVAADGGLLISKTTAVEKYTATGARVLIGANPFINAPAAPCATSNTMATRAVIGPSGSIFMLHSAASANNQTNIISASGYSVAGDCLAAVDGSTANHIPTAALYHSSGKMLVAYGSSTGPVNQIVSYTVTVNSMTAATASFSNGAVLQGISHMAEMSDGSVLVSAASSGFNTIEKFTYNATSQALTRVGTMPFISNVFTRSVSAIVAEQ